MVILALCSPFIPKVQAIPETDKAAPDRVLVAQVAPNPLMSLPGMKPVPSTPAPQPRSFPDPVISDVLNAPNPFDSRKSGLEGQTQISYRLTQDLPVRVSLYSLVGMLVRRWEFPAGAAGGKTGDNHFFWDGTNEAGQKVAKGGYLAQFEIETPQTVVTVVRKIAVIH